MYEKSICNLVNLSRRIYWISIIGYHLFNLIIQLFQGIMPTSMGSRRSSHAIKQLSVTKDDSFEEESESEVEEVIKFY